MCTFGNSIVFLACITNGNVSDECRSMGAVQLCSDGVRLELRVEMSGYGSERSKLRLSEDDHQ